VEFTDISSQNGGSVIVSWFWEFGDPASGGLNTSTLQDPTHLFSTAGTFDVLLLVTNVEGCSDTILLPVVVNMVPEVSFTTDSDSACVDTEISFFGQSSSTVTWSWDFGDGGISVLQNPVHVYIDAGIYNVTLTVEDGNGCINAVTNSVYVNPLPIADFTFSSLSCSGSPVEFIDISSPMNAYMLEWHWQFGDGSDTIIYAPSSGDVSHTYASPGTYTVLLSVLNSNSCEDSIAYDISVIQGPEAGFEHSGDVCQGGTVQFTDLSQGFGSLIQVWLWSFGDPTSGANNSSSLQNPTHMYVQSGTYDVSLTVTSNTGCTHNVVQQVEISPPPGVDWFVNPDTTCFGELTWFFTDPDSTNIAEVVSYSWNFGDPSSGINDTSNLQNPVHMFTAPGTYTITLGIVNIDGCENTSVHDIEIKNVPVADYEYQQACLGDSTLFTDMSISQSSVITSWQWNFGDPASGAMNTSTLQNTGHVFTDLGTYLVELIATDYFGCSDTTVKTLVVDYAPISFFKYNQPCDPPGLVYFNDSSYTQAGAAPIVEWLWELEPGYFSSEINPVYTYTLFDTCFMVSLLVTDANGCESLHTDSVCVDVPLGVDFSATRVCHGLNSFFDGEYLPADDTIISWTWDFDDGNVVVGDSDTISHLYTQSGTHYVTLTVVNQKGCERSILHEVIVDALPAVDFVFSEAICDDPTYFTDMTDPGYGAGIDTWLWNFGDLSSGPDNVSSEQNPQHSYSAVDSTYFVSLLVSNTHGCVDSLKQELQKGLCIRALFRVCGNPCNGSKIYFWDTSYVIGDNISIQSWHWDFGDGETLSYNQFIEPVCHEYDNWGEYTITLIVTADAGGQSFSDSMQRSLTVGVTPEAEMAFQLPCVMSGTQFFDISTTHGMDITSWRWDFGDPDFTNDTSLLQNPVYVYNEPGVYTIELIVENENRCIDTVETDLEVFNTPEAAFSNEIACAGGLTIFTDESIPADADLVYWLWSFGTGQTSGQQDPVYVYPDTGNFVVQMIVTDQNQCSDSATAVVNVFPVPLSAFDILDNYENVQGQILLDNLSESAVHYEWDFGNGDTSELFSPVVRYENNGTYLIELIAWNDKNCPDTAYMEYVIVFQGLYVPTGFTPTSANPDLRLFKPAGVNLEYYQVTLINQWGNIVWQSNKLDDMGRPLEGWDGSTNGKPQPTGTYMWSISAKFKDGTSWNGTDAGDGNTKTFGTVLLIR
jgi:PKD repeat protein